MKERERQNRGSEGRRVRVSRKKEGRTVEGQGEREKDGVGRI